MPIYCRVDYTNGCLICYLPITRTLGKIRVLRADQQVAPRQTVLEERDIIEWQISYFANKGTKLVELGRLLELAYGHKLVSKAELLSLLAKIKLQREFFAEKYAITLHAPIGEFYGFDILKKEVPVLVKEISDVFIWVELRHKQRAVGFQPMLFLRIPLKAVSPNLVGRKAEPNEIVYWKIPPQIILITIKAFSIASAKHHSDMVSLLGRVLQEK